MSNYQQLLRIRSKKLGLLIFDARTAMRRSIEECAETTGVSPELFQEFEKGTKAPSLPQLELLALFLNIPLEHFWGKQALSETAVFGAGGPGSLQEKDRLVILRNRVIGTSLRLGRNNANISLQELSEKTGIAIEKIQRYELGDETIPVTDLEILASAMDIPMDRFYDQRGPIGKWRSQQSAMQSFLELPPDIQQFVLKPIHRPYLEVAMRLSELSAEKLRSVAEVLLEITY